MQRRLGSMKNSGCSFGGAVFRIRKSIAGLMAGVFFIAVAIASPLNDDRLRVRIEGKSVFKIQI
jgi:hypothetical protein